MPPEEAFIGVLACAVAADQNIADEEIRLIELICHFHNFTRELSANIHNEISGRVRNNVSEVGWHEALDGYWESLPETWRGTTFLLSLDIVFIDGKEHDGEKAFVNIIANKMRIDSVDLKYLKGIFKEKHAIPSS